MKSVLVIDDDSDLRGFMTRSLSKYGYQVFVAEDGKTGIELAILNNPSAILLDLHMPGIDGKEVCRFIKSNPKTSHIPIIILTGNAEICDEVEGLEIGADDYLAKPFDFKVMYARLEKTISRIHNLKKEARTNESSSDNVLSAGKVVLNLLNQSITIDGHEAALTPTEFKILAALMRHKGEVISRDQLIKEVWEEKTGNVNRFVDTHINKLRKKFGPHKDYLQTRYGSGYCFKA